MTSIQQHVTETFERQYGEPPAYVIRAPGRVNLIGEHTDYNDGFVLPLAIDRAMWIALRPRTDRQVSIRLIDFDEQDEFALDHFEKGSSSPLEYIKGVAWALLGAGYDLTGWEGVAQSDVPIGAGLSSSAALELATARSFSAISNLDWNPATMAKLSQKAENQWVGVNCGIMDQMISAAGKIDHALLIDCRTLETTPAPFPSGTVVVVMDTMTRRPLGGLVGTAYNERREQCEAAARYFGVPALRDVSLADFEVRGQGLDEIIRRRARHVITEDERTLQAKDAMFAGDAVTLGKLMDASHVSMRDDFEISTPALNAIVECAQTHEACFGARMTGGGFGGCAVTLVKLDLVESFVSHVMRCYTEKIGITAQLYVCHATNGAEVITQPG